MRHEYKSGEPLYSEPSKFDLWMETEGKFIKEKIERNGLFQCFWCKTNTGLTTHHVLPLSLGGIDINQNKVRLCMNCHIKLHRILDSKLNVTERFTLEVLNKYSVPKSI